MLSILSSLSGYDILVQLGVEIMTVYRMKLFLCVIQYQDAIFQCQHMFLQDRI